MNSKLAESYAIYFEQLINTLSHYVIEKREAPEDLLAAIKTLEPLVEDQFAPNDFEQLIKIERAYQTWLRGNRPEGQPHWVGRTE